MKTFHLVGGAEMGTLGSVKFKLYIKGEHTSGGLMSLDKGKVAHISCPPPPQICKELSALLNR